MKKIIMLINKIFKRDKTVFFPMFNSQETLLNQYFRAQWYLLNNFKYSKTYLHSPYLSSWNMKSTNPPENMAQNLPHNDNIILKKGLFHYVYSLLTAKNILIWNEHKWIKVLKLIQKHLPVSIVNVDTHSLDAKEYGRYCDFTWKYFLTGKERKYIIKENHDKFREIYSKIEGKYKSACVFGTGPSLNLAYDFDFSNTLCIGCNSIVQNKRLLDHIKPKFITAGDVVSHLGVSKYAEVFRRDLIEVLLTRDVYFLTTMPFGFLFMKHHPEVRHKIILAPQGHGAPSINLCKDFRLPTLDSTMNIHMLPLAATFSKRIYIIGADGKNPHENMNEDFWAHSKQAQYHDLVQTGHKTHPTFDFHRQQNTYNRYLKSIKTTFENGETYGIKYYSLAPSYIQEINKRKLNFSVQSDHKPFLL